jgi:hypothetical protein
MSAFAWRCCAMLLAPLAWTIPRLAAAQMGVLAQGVVDAEAWKTDTGSALLARDHGRASALGRADVWSAIEPLRDVVLFGELTAEAGAARRSSDEAVRAKQFGVRFSPSDALTIEGGRIQQIVGTFASRSLSFRNPLIGTPDGYTLSYPYGIAASGTTRMLDYRAALISLPLFHPSYTPAPSAAARPAVGAGITPFVGFRIGVSGTVGPYLNCNLSSLQLGGREWQAFRQRIAAADVELSSGYFEGHAEFTHSSYDVPGANPIVGYNGYLEGKLTVTPRLYIATRVERNDYPFVLPTTSAQWIAVRSAFSDAELGGGYRPTSTTLVKLSLRADRWTRSPNFGAPQANGYALAMQASQTFDLLDMMTR